MHCEEVAGRPNSVCCCVAGCAGRAQEEAKVQHEWVTHLHDRWFSKRTSRAPRALHLAHSAKETLWASAMVRPGGRSLFPLLLPGMQWRPQGWPAARSTCV